MANIEDKYRALAVHLARSGTQAEKAAVANWARELLAIRDTSRSPWEKIMAALSVTAKGEVIWPALKMMAAELKRSGWDERSHTGRLASVGLGAGAALFAGQTAGVAALGAAMGLPIWIVVGTGDDFARALVEQIEVTDGLRPPTAVKTSGKKRRAASR